MDYTDVLSVFVYINYRDGRIDVHEFEALWKYVQEWRNCFERYVHTLFGAPTAVVGFQWELLALKLHNSHCFTCTCCVGMTETDQGKLTALSFIRL